MVDNILQILHFFTVFVFCLIVLSISEKGVLQTPTVIVA